MAQIHNLESKSRFGTKYIAGLLLIISSLLIAGWFGFFVFLPICLPITLIAIGLSFHSNNKNMYDLFANGVK